MLAGPVDLSRTQHNPFRAPADRRAQPDMIDLTVNEIRRLINALLIRPTRSIAYRLHWSNWRRRHQARARRAHYARRLSLEIQP